MPQSAVVQLSTIILRSALSPCHPAKVSSSALCVNIKVKFNATAKEFKVHRLVWNVIQHSYSLPDIDQKAII